MRLRSLSWLLWAILPTACGPGAPSPEAAAPFRTAVEAYLRTQNMEMRPDTFAALAVDGDSATAEVRMAAKGVEYGIRPRWTFRFVKKGGAWQVSDVKR
jgi:hypothetical protein